MFGKYIFEILLFVLRFFIEVRNKVNVVGFFDNGGVIYLVECIIDVFCICVKYGFIYVNNLKKMLIVECSIGVYEVC